MVSTRAVDLVAVANVLPPTRRRLKNLLLKLRDAHSTHTDLRLAVDFVGSLRLVREQAIASEAGSVAENSALALFYSAIILYARATKARSNHRRTFDFRSQFDEQEMKAHQVLCDLRDDAVAHFGPGGSYSGPAWQKEGVFLPMGDDKIMSASRRIVVNPEMILAMDRQIHRALMLSERNQQEANTVAAAALNEVVQEDPEFPAFCRAQEIDLTSFFGSADAALEVLSGPRVGSRKGKIQHPSDS